MIDVFETNKFLVILINIIAVWLGIWVYASNKAEKINKTFSYTIALMLICVDFAYLARFIYFGLYIDSSEIYLSFFFLKIAWFATPLFFLALYILTIQLIGKETQYRMLTYAVAPIVMANSLITGFTDSVVQKVNFGYDFLEIVYGDGMQSFMIILIFLIIITLSALLKEYFAVSLKEKGKIEYLLAGLIIFYSSIIIFNIAFPVFTGEVRYYFVGYYSSIILIAFIAYAIVNKNLFNIKIILTALLVSYISIILALDILAFTQSFSLKLFKGISLLIFIYLGRKLINDVLQEEERLKKKEKLARDLETANTHLKDLMNMKASFLHIVSHQLRTPLTAMRGFISMWREGDFNSYSAQKMSIIKERIANNAERLNNLVNDMVVAMESEGNLELTFAKISLTELIKNNIEFLKSNYEKKKLYIEFEKEIGYPRDIEADPKYLNNAIMNLIDNAEKYTAQGGLKIKIAYGPDNVVATFTDTGVGISASDRKNLFHKFSRGADSGRINPNGSGLGLFIIKEIIEKHRGKIELLSEGTGKGTTFKITLPLKQQKTPTDHLSKENNDLPSAQSKDTNKNQQNLADEPTSAKTTIKKQPSFFESKTTGKT